MSKKDSQLIVNIQLRVLRQRGFTLVELLIVVVILGILAAVVMPQFTDASADAKFNALLTDLAHVRKQLEHYRLQHNGRYPSLVDFVDHMTKRTNADGSMTGSPKFGPYLSRIPTNLFTEQDDVGVGAIGSSSWYYNVDTGEFKANCHAAHFAY